MNHDKIMIVAHPDDETIFGGTQLLQEENWLVVCVTNGDNQARRNEFKKVMERVHAEYEIWSYEDRWGGDFDRARLREDLRQVLARKPVNKVVTHNPEGEYGHTQHKALSEIVHELVAANLYVFAASEDRVRDDLLNRKRKLLALYESQDIEWLKLYIEFECIKQAK